MRLIQIKLSGFKSFVDPTQIQVPSQLVAIVGPNGCGKSNVIDAVRWVLGETKASELRGESMLDVIFNGSTGRKAAARASVELVFDNSLGRLGGPWSGFAEVSVKRVLTRDATSSYFINNQVVRRRDIHDMFMGTGLGSKGYAIIGQGMIARIIEAKPEELRVFLEEAAGVSKYKERRRETENRLSDTRENLLRIDDILMELETQLEKLQQQAIVAQDYQRLQGLGEVRLHQFWWSKQLDADNERLRVERDIGEATLELDVASSQLTNLASQAEELRQQHYEATDEVQSAQENFYDVNVEVSQLEAQIKYTLEAQQRIKQQLLQLEQQSHQWSEKKALSLQTLDDLSSQIEEAHALMLELDESMSILQDELPGLENKLDGLTRTEQEKRSHVSKHEQSLALISQKQGDINQQLKQIVVKRERLSQESAQAISPDEHQLDELTQQTVNIQNRMLTLSDEQQVLDELLVSQSVALEAHKEQLIQEQQRLTQLQTRFETLNDIQQAAYAEGGLPVWLEQQGLAQFIPLWQQIKIDPEWAFALEAILKERLQAVRVSRLETLNAYELNPPPASMCFYSPGHTPSNRQVQIPGRPRLFDKLKDTEEDVLSLLNVWLSDIYLAESLADALAHRHELPDQGLFVLKNGHQVTSHDLLFYAPDNERNSTFSRQQELDNLGKEIKAQQLLLSDTQAKLTLMQSGYDSRRATLLALQQDYKQQEKKYHESNLEISRLKQLLNEYAFKRQQVESQQAELEMQQEELLATSEHLEHEFERVDQELALLQESQVTVADQYEQVKRDLEHVRQQLREKERSANEWRVQQSGWKYKQDELQRNIAQATDFEEQTQAELVRLREEYASLSEDTRAHGLQSLLERRVQAEKYLTSQRVKLDELSQAMRQLEEQRLHMERSLEPRRIRINELTLKQQAARLTQEQFLSQLHEHEVDLLALQQTVNELPKEHQRASWLQQDMQRINQQIAMLGAVNLAALQELNEAQERRQYLDLQRNDLQTAITTLEDAIRKIDRETRQLLHATFEQVNAFFGELFPQLFGGGEAKLVMTGDEILDAGVQVMAQPPGKKNSTIHLLSGGEKALTATALVFAMFKLNPAPFCLLDEVDAPLDDANTERYAQLVRRMSDQTQFLFISHNKIAMEIAHQLVGVTMQEQGVSRIVAVDVESALQLQLDNATD